MPYILFIGERSFMYFEITETYPAEIIDSNLMTLSVPLAVSYGSGIVRESIRLLIDNDKNGENAISIISGFLKFCQSVINKRTDSSSSPVFSLDLKGIEKNIFIKSIFKYEPKQIQLKIYNEAPNRMRIVFPSGSSAIKSLSFNIGMTTFYFMFSALINIRNYIDFNSLDFNSSAKNQLLKYKTWIDEVFDSLIVNNVFKGIYECRLSRCVDDVPKEERTVITAIKNSVGYYGVKSYSRFTACDYNFMLFEHNDIEETALFEYKFKCKIYDI